jgi:hypothetical protein
VTMKASQLPMCTRIMPDKEVSRLSATIRDFVWCICHLFTRGSRALWGDVLQCIFDRSLRWAYAPDSKCPKSHQEYTGTEKHEEIQGRL